MTMTTDGEANAKSCRSGEASLKRNSDHLDAQSTNEQQDDSTSDSNAPAAPSPNSRVCSSPEPVNCAGEEVKSSDEKKTDSKPAAELIDFTVVFEKNKYEISMSSTETVASLKQLLEKRVGVPATTQKLLFKGLARQEMSLTEWGLKCGSRVILMGTRLADLMNVQHVPVADASGEESKPESGSSEKEPLCRQKPHNRIIEKGKPADASPALKGVKAPLPLEPLSGMVNKSGGKVRLTFKHEADQLWIGTKERTEKVSMTSIRNVISEPIEGHEEYHMMAIQLGPTEASRYWIYWVPAQYVDAIRWTILGV